MKPKLAILIAALIGAVSCGADQAEPGPEVGREAVAAALNDAVRLGFPGGQAVIDDRGEVWKVSAGAGDLATGAPFADDARFRIASNTKTFVATVALQLVGEGRLELDVPVERYLPGVVHGPGIDGGRITLRNLLQHTSGLPEFAAEFGATPAPHQIDYLSPQVRWQIADVPAILRSALNAPADFEPGSKWAYSNTNYVVAGMVIEQITGTSVGTEITRRILEPLALRDTYYPEPGETALRGPHPIGYSEVRGERVDYTDQNVSAAGAAGAMVSTGADLARFFAALLDGKLLPPAQLADMQQVRAIEGSSTMTYGLGLLRLTLPCGLEFWGHNGGIPGSLTYGGVVPATGRAVAVAMNQDFVDAERFPAPGRVLTAALCAGQPAR
ncbi:serine hydrolase domain-containing protein [Nocardia sp. NPDC050435]|uniref:serine hydrolase domain-containing protein n=1 Tax=Nocardia sp. NPDC050435 TaxID=3155040 RepID=UPI0033E43B84